MPDQAAFIPGRSGYGFKNLKGVLDLDIEVMLQHSYDVPSGILVIKRHAI